MFDRRDFLVSAGALLALPGFAVRNSSIVSDGEKPKLRFGVISDLHLAPQRNFGAQYLKRALIYFRDLDVDAVAITGDITDWGCVDQLQVAADVWNEVFKDGRGKSGRIVEKLFVTGNHDRDGWSYGTAKKYFQNHPELAEGANRIASDYQRNWKDVLGEDYQPIHIKEVNGYRFVLNNELFYQPKCAFLEDHRKELAGERPFFYLQHFHPMGTCSAPWTWGQDAGYSTKALSLFPNAIAFSGHSHTPLVDERTIWQGSFTSVGAGSLRFLVPFGGRENSLPFSTKDPMPSQMNPLGRCDSQQGLLVTVYEDRVVFGRMDFHDNAIAGPDWVMPLPFDGSLAFDKRAEKALVPEFGGADKVCVDTSRDAEEGGERMVVSFPCVKDWNARAYDYEINVELSDVDVERVMLSKRVYSPGFFRCPSKDSRVVKCVFSRSELPVNYPLKTSAHSPTCSKGRQFRFAVRPLNCWGRSGKPIYSKWFVDFSEQR